jgi:hypothetical protein
MSSPNPPAQENPFGTWVRSWVHYDNLANNYGKQAAGARKMRDDFETKIIQNLRANNMEKAVIQVSGAKLTLADDSITPSLSFPRIEQYLHSYFQQKGNHMDETEQILRFIRIQRQKETRTNQHLKKTPIGPALPPLPPPPSGHIT